MRDHNNLSNMSRDIKSVKNRWHQFQLQTTKEQSIDNDWANFQDRILWINIFFKFYILVRQFFIWFASGRSQKQAFRENRDSDRLNNGFELKIWSANLTLSGPKLTNLQMIIFIFDRFRAFFLGSVFFCPPGM